MYSNQTSAKIGGFFLGALLIEPGGLISLRLVLSQGLQLRMYFNGFVLCTYQEIEKIFFEFVL
jgi:hypothetical protein